MDIYGNSNRPGNIYAPDQIVEPPAANQSRYNNESTMEHVSKKGNNTMGELDAVGALPPLAVGNYGALPMEVLHDILLRLPADEVCHVRLVCRSWRSLTSDPLFVAAHASRHPHVVAVSHHMGNHDAAEVRAVDLHDKVIKRRRIRLPANRHVLGRLSVHGDLLCASHGGGLACVVDMVTGAVVADVDSEHPWKESTRNNHPQCFIGHVPSTGEYKVLRIQVDRSSATCDVVTLGGGGSRGGGTLRWRRRRQPPVRLNVEPPSCFGNMAVVAGLAYFLVIPSPRGPNGEPSVEADSIAVFDLATEEWKPATLQGPLSSRSGRRCTDDDDEGDEPMPVLRRNRFQLARLGESLVMLYCNVEDCSTELWFLELEDMEDGDSGMATRWIKRYTLQRTPFGKDDLFSPSSSLQYHHPLAVLDDGKILVWVNRMSALRIYDPETSVWMDLVTLTQGRVVGMQRGSPLCTNLGVA